MKTNLILKREQVGNTFTERVNSALVDLILAGGTNVSLIGCRDVDQALRETIWSDAQEKLTVHLIEDAEIPASWITVEASDPSQYLALLQCLNDALPVLDYEILRDNARSCRRGALTQWALTDDQRLAEEFPPVLETALTSSDAGVREDAAMAARLASLPSTRVTLFAASKRETNAGVKAMLEEAASSIGN